MAFGVDLVVIGVSFHIVLVTSAIVVFLGWRSCRPRRWSAGDDITLQNCSASQNEIIYIHITVGRACHHVAINLVGTGQWKEVSALLPMMCSRRTVPDTTLRPYRGAAGGRGRHILPIDGDGLVWWCKENDYLHLMSRIGGRSTLFWRFSDAIVQLCYLSLLI